MTKPLGGKQKVGMTTFFVYKLVKLDTIGWRVGVFVGLLDSKRRGIHNSFLGGLHPNRKGSIALAHEEGIDLFTICNMYVIVAEFRLSR
jgi:hypothetical protein